MILYRNFVSYSKTCCNKKKNEMNSLLTNESNNKQSKGIEKMCNCLTSFDIRARCLDTRELKICPVRYDTIIWLIENECDMITILENPKLKRSEKNKALKRYIQTAFHIVSLKEKDTIIKQYWEHIEEEAKLMNDDETDSDKEQHERGLMGLEDIKVCVRVPKKKAKSNDWKIKNNVGKAKEEYNGIINHWCEMNSIPREEVKIYNKLSSYVKFIEENIDIDELNEWKKRTAPEQVELTEKINRWVKAYERFHNGWALYSSECCIAGDKNSTMLQKRKLIEKYKITEESTALLENQLVEKQDLKEKIKECDNETMANINYDVITRLMEKRGKCRGDEEARKQLTCNFYDVTKYGLSWEDRDILYHHYDIMNGGGFIMK